MSQSVLGVLCYSSYFHTASGMIFNTRAPLGCQRSGMRLEAGGARFPKKNAAGYSERPDKQEIIRKNPRLFCRVCVLRVRVWKSHVTYLQKFRVRVWKSYRTHRVRGRYTNVAPVPAPAPGYFFKGIPVPRVLCHGRTELAQAPGTGINVIHNLLAEVPGTGNTPGMVLSVPYRTQPFRLPKFRVRVRMKVLQNSQKFRVRVWKSYRTHRKSREGIRMLYSTRTRPRPRVFHKRAYPYSGHCATGEQNLEKFRVRVRMSYRTCRSSGYG